MNKYLLGSGKSSRNSMCNTVNKNLRVRKTASCNVKYEFGKEVFSSVVDSNSGSAIRIRVLAAPIE